MLISRTYAEDELEIGQLTCDVTYSVLNRILCNYYACSFTVWIYINQEIIGNICTYKYAYAYFFLFFLLFLTYPYKLKTKIVIEKKLYTVQSKSGVDMIFYDYLMVENTVKRVEIVKYYYSFK